MRLTIFLIISLLYSSLIKAQTTLEEYNYLTKGYKIQIESGLDMKKGYTLEDVGTESVDNYKATIKKLYKGTDETPVAYLVVYQPLDGETEYICIPHPNSDEDILMSYFNSISSSDQEASRIRGLLVLWTISKHLLWS